MESVWSMGIAHEERTVSPIFTGPSRKHEPVEGQMLDLLRGRVASIPDLEALVEEFCKGVLVPCSLL